ncbi:(2Fe-2S)-binding protein [Rhodococcus sp. ACPA4]|uniref:(2Fe-2S)-binding protein n=1 Tax=Rhodococcus sp. ACPA4 TaxID=2028571 RepID=UPI000BB16309|nr:2Fe-2S iron-sulfur cluster-binding protein [Rhodococcus sp. ACPA4]PBC35911.1 (2Fe-2S)-binding protein [Rhodococcus sp. ACPA4]
MADLADRGADVPRPGRTLTVNDEPLTVTSSAGATLLEVLRGAGHTDVKEACGRGECGACTVLVGGRAVMACTQLAALVTGDVTTADGLGEAAADLREAFADYGAFQCGFCTPGQIVRAESILLEYVDISRDEVVRCMSGNICRCTGYRQIVDAVCAVASSRRNDPEGKS